MSGRASSCIGGLSALMLTWIVMLARLSEVNGAVCDRTALSGPRGSSTYLPWSSGSSWSPAAAPDASESVCLFLDAANGTHVVQIEVEDLKVAHSDVVSVGDPGIPFDQKADAALANVFLNISGGGLNVSRMEIHQNGWLSLRSDGNFTLKENGSVVLGRVDFFEGVVWAWRDLNVEEAGAFLFVGSPFATRRLVAMKAVLRGRIELQKVVSAELVGRFAVQGDLLLAYNSSMLLAANSVMEFQGTGNLTVEELSLFRLENEAEVHLLDAARVVVRGGRMAAVDSNLFLLGNSSITVKGPAAAFPWHLMISGRPERRAELAVRQSSYVAASENAEVLLSEADVVVSNEGVVRLEHLNDLCVNSTVFRASDDGRISLIGFDSAEGLRNAGFELRDRAVLEFSSTAPPSVWPSVADGFRVVAFDDESVVELNPSSATASLPYVRNAFSFPGSFRTLNSSMFPFPPSVGDPGVYSFFGGSSLKLNALYPSAGPPSLVTPAGAVNRTVVRVQGYLRTDSKTRVRVGELVAAEIVSGGRVEGGGDWTFGAVGASTLLVHPARCNSSFASAAEVTLLADSSFRSAAGRKLGVFADDGVDFSSGTKLEGNVDLFLETVVNVGLWRWERVLTPLSDTYHSFNLPFWNYGETRVEKGAAVFFFSSFKLNKLPHFLLDHFNSSCHGVFQPPARASLCLDSSALFFSSNATVFNATAVDPVLPRCPHDPPMTYSNSTNSTLRLELDGGGVLLGRGGSVCGADVVNIGGSVGDINSTMRLEFDRTYVHCEGKARLQFAFTTDTDFSSLVVRDFEVRRTASMQSGRDLLLWFRPGFEPYRGLAVPFLTIERNVRFVQDGVPLPLSASASSRSPKADMQGTLVASGTAEEEFLAFLRREVKLEAMECSNQCQACAQALNFTWDPVLRAASLRFLNPVCRPNPYYDAASHKDAVIPSDIVAVYYLFACGIFLVLLLCHCCYCYWIFHIRRGKSAAGGKAAKQAFASNIVLNDVLDEDDEVLGLVSSRRTTEDGQMVPQGGEGEAGIVNVTAAGETDLGLQLASWAESDGQETFEDDDGGERILYTL